MHIHKLLTDLNLKLEDRNNAHILPEENNIIRKYNDENFLVYLEDKDKNIIEEYDDKGRILYMNKNNQIIKKKYDDNGNTLYSYEKYPAFINEAHYTYNDENILIKSEVTYSEFSHVTQNYKLSYITTELFNHLGNITYNKHLRYISDSDKPITTEIFYEYYPDNKTLKKEYSSLGGEYHYNIHEELTYVKYTNENGQIEETFTSYDYPNAPTFASYRKTIIDNAIVKEVWFSLDGYIIFKNKEDETNQYNFSLYHKKTDKTVKLKNL
jgi:hypothetical protein